MPQCTMRASPVFRWSPASQVPPDISITLTSTGSHPSSARELVVSLNSWLVNRPWWMKNPGLGAKIEAIRSVAPSWYPKKSRRSKPSSVSSSKRSWYSGIVCLR